MQLAMMVNQSGVTQMDSQHMSHGQRTIQSSSL
nr:MAG TPA: hypothetical protein [Caudoviricetes sp.]